MAKNTHGRALSVPSLGALSLGLGSGLAGPIGGAGGAAPSPPTAPSAFSIGNWSVVDAHTGGDLTVIVTAMPSNGGAAITGIDYRINGGAYVASGISAPGSFGISGLTDNVSVTVELRANNSVGNGPASDVKLATPTAGGETVSGNLMPVLFLFAA